jgi:glucosamine--fructose-6-phosphate aminotransferase (isomerizing)
MKPMKKDTMEKQLNSLSALVKAQFPIVVEKVQQQYTNDELKRIHHIYVTGDGDSWHAAMAAEMAFDQFAKINYFPIPAMEFLDYGADYINQIFPGTYLVIGVSASGGSTRVVECFERMEKVAPDVATLGIVGNLDSKIGKAGKKALSVEIAQFDPSPGIRTYLASMMGLYALAIQIGEAKGNLTSSQANNLRTQFTSLAPIIEATLKYNNEPTRQAAQAIAKKDFISFVGSGPSHASAYFSSAKVVEAAGIFSATQDLEEWAHVEGLAYPLDFPVYIVAPKGKSSWRAEKLAEYAKFLGHPMLIVADQNDEIMRAQADYFFPIVGEVDEVFSPVVTHIPGTLLAHHLIEATHRLPFMMDNQEATKRSEFVTQQIKEKDTDN